MARPQTSTRDAGALIPSLSAWLRDRGALDRRAQIQLLGGPTGGGFSSETVLFDVVLDDERSGYALRLPPPKEAFPLFPWYDLERQARAMRLVRAHTDVPVPAVPWFEPDPAILGAPFFVMERIDGLAPADVPPYVLDGWVLATPPQDRVRMQSGVVDALAGIHDVHVPGDELTFLEFEEAGDTPLRRHVAHQRTYYEWIRGVETFDLIEATFQWLDGHWPEDEGATVISWGDSRLANVLFRDAEPVAILDWEAVALGPRELDLGWLIFFHDYFQRIARKYGHDGLPDFFRRADVENAYADATGHVPRDLDWYLVYAALRQALTSIRVSLRAVHFGEREQPADVNDLVADRPHLERTITT
jgi:aminoglycoside phosphotransferase (APT) family kinase protein